MSRNTFSCKARLSTGRFSPASRFCASLLLCLPILLALLSGSALRVQAQVLLPDIRIKPQNPINPPAPKRHLASKILIKLRQGVDPGGFAQAFTAAAAGHHSSINLAGFTIGLPKLNALKRDHSNASIAWHTYRIPNATYMKSVLTALKHCPQVVYAEPDWPIKRLAMPFGGQGGLAQPDDTYWQKEDLQHLIVVLSQLDTPQTARNDDSASWTYTWSLETVNAFDAWSVYPGHYHTAAERALLYQTDPGSLPLVAVIDSGVDMTHPDFSYVSQSTEDPVKTSDTDVANGGQIAHSLARNFVSGNTDPNPDLAQDDIGHGTSVSGVIAAAPNNSRGIPGLGFPAQIVPLKVIDANGNGEDSDLIDAITYAVDHHCLLINTSLTLDTTEFPQALQDAVDYAWRHGTLIISAAGNDGDNSGNPPIPALGQVRRYPASLVHVLGVAATSYGGDGTGGELLASYSNYGYGLGVAAPGGDVTTFQNTSPNGSDLGLNPLQEYVLIWTLAPTYKVLLSDPDPANPDGTYAALGLYGQFGPINNGPYGAVPGTSFACPHVTALAALYAAKNHITQSTPNAPQKIINAIEKGCHQMNGRADGGFDPTFGYGRIDALATISDDNPRNATVGGFIGQVTVFGTPVHNVQVVASAVGSGRKFYAATFDDGIYHMINLPAGKYIVTASAFGYSGAATVNVAAGSDLHGISFALPPQAIRIHCGGGQVTTSSGAVFSSDEYYNGGSPYSWLVPPTTDRALYSTVRYAAQSFRYNLPVGPGTYTLKLYFDEARPYGVGKRMFNVNVNGSTILPKFDIVAAAGGWGKPVVKTMTITISDSAGVNILFNAIKLTPIISAIELVPTTQTP